VSLPYNSVFSHNLRWKFNSDLNDRKDVGNISYISRVIAHLILNFVFVTTGFGHDRICLTSFDSHMPYLIGVPWWACYNCSRNIRAQKPVHTNTHTHKERHTASDLTFCPTQYIALDRPEVVNEWMWPVVWNVSLFAHNYVLVST